MRLYRVIHKDGEVNYVEAMHLNDLSRSINQIRPTYGVVTRRTRSVDLLLDEDDPQSTWDERIKAAVPVGCGIHRA